MGTSGAFGGSDTKPWKKVREALDEVLDGGGPGGPPGNGQPDQPDGDGDGKGDDLAELVEQIAQALKVDDPRVRPNRHLTNTNPSAAIGPLLERLGRTGGGGRRHGPTSGRRDLAGTSRRAGRALYAGFAAASGDAAALDACGIDAGRLQGKQWLEQILVIADEVIGSSANADEQALRDAVVRILANLDPDAPREPIEAIRDVIAAYVTELAGVELVAALTAREITDQQAQQLEDEVRAYIEVRKDAIEIPETQLVTIQDFEDAAELLMQEVLIVLGPTVVR